VPDKFSSAHIQSFRFSLGSHSSGQAVEDEIIRELIAASADMNDAKETLDDNPLQGLSARQAEEAQDSPDEWSSMANPKDRRVTFKSPVYLASPSVSEEDHSSFLSPDKSPSIYPHETELESFDTRTMRTTTSVLYDRLDSHGSAYASRGQERRSASFEGEAGSVYERSDASREEAPLLTSRQSDSGSVGQGSVGQKDPQVNVTSSWKKRFMNPSGLSQAAGLDSKKSRAVGTSRNRWVQAVRSTRSKACQVNSGKLNENFYRCPSDNKERQESQSEAFHVNDDVSVKFPKSVSTFLFSYYRTGTRTSVVYMPDMFSFLWCPMGR